MTKAQLALALLSVLLLGSSVSIVYCLTWLPSALATATKLNGSLNNFSCSDAGEMYMFPMSEIVSALVAGKVMYGANDL